ncbi:MAG TPA: LCP family protein [Syntrophomonadaceae bacterium]|nr:LCP family protein [Syntrophomonadaceae bacterium]
MKKHRKLIMILVIVFTLTFGTGILLGNLLQSGFFKESIEDKALKGKPINILVMGIDARSAEENSRSDTMILVSIDRKTKKVAMVWIPRDTKVEVGLGRSDRINSINLVKGPEAACNTVGKLLGVKVDYYAVINFSGFIKIIDILGGVEVDVGFNMNHYDPDPKLAINLSKGKQLLNGQDALGYVRYRGGPTADIGRTQRQQTFIKAVAKEMFRPKNIIKLPKILPEAFRQVKTNIPTNDILYIINLAREFDAESVVTQTLPGYPFTDPRSGASYWEADKEIAKGIIDDLFAGKTYDVAQDPPNWVKPAPNIYKEPVLEDEEADEIDEIDETDEIDGDSADDEDTVDIEDTENIEVDDKNEEVEDTVNIEDTGDISSEGYIIE